MNGHVLANKLLVKKDKAENKTDGGIILPEPYIDPPNRGTVVLTGESKGDTPMEIKVGDSVLFAEHAGTPIHLKEPDMSLNGEYVLLDQQNVLFFKR